MFFGIIFDNAPFTAPFAFLNRQVIDMLYFPLFSFNWPDWIPFVGGNSFHFFSAIFNIVDSSIIIGVMILLIWQKTFFSEVPQKESVAGNSGSKTTSQAAENKRIVPEVGV